MRKVAIDFGPKRTGIAITDPNGKIVTFTKIVEPSEILKEIKKVDALSEVIFGFPINLKMRFTKSTIDAVDKSIEIAKSILPVPVYLVDERFTSSIANSRINVSKGRNRKTLVDGLSASVILEDYIHGMKAHRVMWELPRISGEIVSLISAIGHFKKIYLVGSGLRGIEFFPIAEEYEIFEEDPAYFRLRQRRINDFDIHISLHFGVFWDIILRRLNEADLLVCDAENMAKIDKCAFPPGLLIVIEEKKGAVHVGGRSLRILRI